MTSAFNSNDDKQATPVEEPSQDSAFTNQLSMIKNESGEQKYENVPKALDALAHSQNYIPQLKDEVNSKDAEIARLTEELSKRAAVGDVVDQLTAKQAQPESTPQVSGLSEQDVMNLVQNFSDQQSVQQVALSNEKSVSDALFTKFGDKTQEVVSGKASELGMTVDALKQLSQRSPQAALQLFQAKASTAPKVSSGSYNIAPSVVQEEGLQRPEKSLLIGATTKEQMDYLEKVRADVYKKFNVEV